MSKQQTDWRERSGRRFRAAAVWMLAGLALVTASAIAAALAYRAEWFAFSDTMLWPAMGGWAAWVVGVALAVEDIVLTRRDRRTRWEGSGQ